MKLFRGRIAKSLTQNIQNTTQATMDETETNSMRIEAYHTATRLHTVDILAGIMPRLRVNPAKQHSEPKPWSLRTRKRMAREICTIYRLLTGHKAETNRDHFHDDGEYRWAQDVPFVLMACGRTVRANKEGLSEASALKRVEVMAQLCDMVHSKSARKAADKYREVVRHGKERAALVTREPKWNRQTASAELARIRSVLAQAFQAIATMPDSEAKTTRLVEWIRCSVLFGADHTDQEQSTLEPLRGGCWPLVTFGILTDVHPKLESSALGCIRTDDNGDMHLDMPQCTKTYTDTSVCLTEACPALVDALELLRPLAIAAHESWVLPPKDAKEGTRCKRNGDATFALHGKRYMPTDARHLCYCAAHGNTAERNEEARRRGATAEATAASYGDK